MNVGVLLATHQRQFLDRVDHVLVLGDGKVSRSITVGSTSYEEGTKEDAVAEKAPLEVVAEEDREIGHIKSRTWIDFIGAGGIGFTLVALSLFFVAQGALMYSDLLFFDGPNNAGNGPRVKFITNTRRSSLSPLLSVRSRASGSSLLVSEQVRSFMLERSARPPRSISMDSSQSLRKDN